MPFFHSVEGIAAKLNGQIFRGTLARFPIINYAAKSAPLEGLSSHPSGFWGGWRLPKKIPLSRKPRKADDCGKNNIKLLRRAGRSCSDHPHTGRWPCPSGCSVAVPEERSSLSRLNGL